jgi:hypothetical protein
MKYFLITALPKSGTTWVQRICRAHPQMHCRAEDQFTKFWSNINDLIKQYNYLVDLRDQQRDRQGIESLTRSDGLKLFYAMIRITLDKAPGQLDWSGIKDLTLSAKGFLRMLPDSRVVNVIRDPRDIAISAWAHGRRITLAPRNYPERVSDEFLMETARHWQAQLRLAETVRTESPGQSFDIRYEDLALNFSSAVGELLAFFDVAHDPPTIEELRLETDFTHLSGGRAPGQTDASSYFRNGLAGDWRTTLSKAQIALVDEICGGELQAQRYDRE